MQIQINNEYKFIKMYFCKQKIQKHYPCFGNVKYILTSLKLPLWSPWVFTTIQFSHFCFKVICT